MILISFKIVVLFNTTLADIKTKSDDVILKSTRILKEMRILQLCVKMNGLYNTAWFSFQFLDYVLRFWIFNRNVVWNYIIADAYMGVRVEPGSRPNCSLQTEWLSFSCAGTSSIGWEFEKFKRSSFTKHSWKIFWIAIFGPP